MEPALCDSPTPVPQAKRPGIEEERMARELSQFETYLVHEFVEDYVDGIMSRRDMMPST